MFEGMTEGMLEGIFEGVLEGREEGRLEGRCDGRVEGSALGWVEGMLDGAALLLNPWHVNDALSTRTQLSKKKSPTSPTASLRVFHSVRSALGRPSAVMRFVNPSASIAG